MKLNKSVVDKFNKLFDEVCEFYDIDLEKNKESIYKDIMGLKGFNSGFYIDNNLIRLDNVDYSKGGASLSLSCMIGIMMKHYPYLVPFCEVYYHIYLQPENYILEKLEEINNRVEHMRSTHKYQVKRSERLYRAKVLQ